MSNFWINKYIYISNRYLCFNVWLGKFIYYDRKIDMLKMHKLNKILHIHMYVFVMCAGLNSFVLYLIGAVHL